MGIAQAIATSKFYLLRLNPYTQLVNLFLIVAVSFAVGSFHWWYILLLPGGLIALWFEVKHSIQAETRQIWEKNEIWMGFYNEDKKFKEEVRRYMEAHP